MNLLEVRTKFIELSGRYDLATDAFADDGADFFIKAGLSTLDRLVQFPKDHMKFFRNVTAGSYSVAYQYGRSVKEVWWIGSDGRKRLERKTINELQSEFGSVAFANVTNGEPLYFCQDLLRLGGDAPTGDYGSAGSETVSDGLILMPPPNEDGQVEIWLLSLTDMPAADDGTNFWFSAHEHIAIHAALYQLEVSYRNSQGADDWMKAIKAALFEIDKDAVEQDTYYAEQMNG